MMESKYYLSSTTFRGNKDFQSWEQKDFFFLSSRSTSKFDERFVSNALLTAPSFVSLQCTWWSSLTGWSSVTLKSHPTGFITTLIIVALAHSARSLSHLWREELSRAFHELRPKQTKGQSAAHPAASHDLPLSPCYKHDMRLFLPFLMLSIQGI